jgi:hypothetical protein
MLPPDKKPKREDIYAAQKIIADISSGIYRSPAAALKELVANAYDADASKVTITTDAPHFRSLIIEDNGIGMSIDRFRDVIKHIGGSRKRVDGETTPSGRKLIGRIGIGMMAVAQLGSRFYVSSTVKGSPTRFIAEVNLDPYHRDDIALASMGKIGEEGSVQIGAVQYVDLIPESIDAHYTVITVPDAKSGLISEMTSQVRKAVGADEPLSIDKRKIAKFEELIEIVRDSKRADIALDGYYYMLWELALLCPINYSKSGPFETHHREIQDVQLFKPPVVKSFKVFVDGVELKRPQLFPNPRAFNYSSPNPKVYVLDFDEEIARRRLRLTGYIYAQQPSVDPEELKGVQIRIRHVGIGKYDRTWLGYPFNEGQKFGQVTGEVFVEEGLEPALNIDRDSFRETDVHYQALRAYIWQTLREKVFPEFKSRQNQYRKTRQRQAQTDYQKRFNLVTLELPAPITGETEYVKTSLTQPVISTWIGVSQSGLIFQKDKWERFAEDRGLKTEEAQQRFIRVLTVLVSNEMLSDLTEDEAEPFLQALAVAVEQ